MPTAPKEVLQLVQKFELNLDSYRSLAYNEAQVRQEFINPLFEALDWDMANRAGNAEAYKDVIHEAAVKIGTATKAPDYAFRIGGTKKFFLEAKKPGVDIKNNPEPSYQLRRYAWSAGLPLSILTDFEEFAVYDCRIKPSPKDKASVGRILYLTYQEYESRWGEIAGVFAKQALLQGSFDRYAEGLKGKRGTTPVDDAFLKEIEDWRSELAHNLARRNSRLKVRDLNFAVQRTIDRIIFLRMCEDRGIEQYGQLQALLNGENVYARLKQMFHAADDKYNSGLFHFKPEQGRAEKPDELTDTLKIDNDVLKQIISRLYYPESPYEFSVLSSDILGSVYEQFLGKVIHLTKTHQARIEEKPEVKKAGGVYYTPKYIVDYIVKNTVGKLCEGKTPKQIEKLNILDPACGSGSFLIGAYSYLLDYHRNWYENNDPAKYTKDVFQGSGGQWYLTTQKKKEILLHNIYGVDIDSQAVEVTKLNLLLKVLEGETKDTLESQMKLFHRRALPDLGNNIKCGNSLIGSDYSHGKQLSFLDEDERLKVNAFDWKAEFSEIMKGNGFDIVIGNPPYGVAFPLDEANYLKNKFQTFVWRGESYLVFVERAIHCLKTNGLIGYIIPDTYLNLDFTKSLRTFILQNSKPYEIVVLPSNVFVGTTVDTTLLFAEKTAEVATHNNSQVLVTLFNKNLPINSIDRPNRTFTISTSAWSEQNAFNVQSDLAETSIISRIESKHKLLSEYAEMFYGIKAYQVGKGKPPQTKEILKKKPFTSTHKKSGKFLPFFDGKHVGRYELNWQRNNWIKYGVWLAEPRQPQKYEGEKLLIRKIVSNTLIATYVPSTSYCNTLLFVLKMKSNNNLSYTYLLGILNSQFIGWYFRKKFQISADDTFPQIMIRDILKFPIPNKDKTFHDKMVVLVEPMLELHKQLSNIKTPDDKTRLQRQIEATDRQIDQLVYELYGLTEEEIAVVEGKK